MMTRKYTDINGVPDFITHEYSPRKNKYCVCIPVINEGERIIAELERAYMAHIPEYVDILLCDGGSTDGSIDDDKLRELGVNTLLTKLGYGYQGAQIRMGFWWALERGYEGIITVDGNNKDSIEDTMLFIDKLNEGYDFIQGSRYIKGGVAINTPITRMLSIRLIHAPLMSLMSGFHFTDSTNGFRGYSKQYLTNVDVNPFRDIFVTYELYTYLPVRAPQLNMKCCEIPVTRRYPKTGKTPTKISFIRGNLLVLRILIETMRGKYVPK